MPRPMTNQDLSDILTTFFEGGNSWCESYAVVTEATDPFTPSYEGEPFCRYMAPAYGGTLTLAVEDDAPPPHPLSRERLLFAIAQRQNEGHIHANPERWDIDATEACAIVEIAVFGEVTFC